eukprot:TRINITY_DN13870_c0_g1_i1.p1 TRINITY_DN13870_c0_g1~~TRINITY_DN13870_c0_g1_i1.p1  ORF type:complete len:427 (-),score=61.09 TRINITY_DN13870_c0_g1_i1:87-1367(-)
MGSGDLDFGDEETLKKRASVALSLMERVNILLEQKWSLKRILMDAKEGRFRVTDTEVEKLNLLYEMERCSKAKKGLKRQKSFSFESNQNKGWSSVDVLSHPSRLSLRVLQKHFYNFGEMKLGRRRYSETNTKKNLPSIIKKSMNIVKPQPKFALMDAECLLVHPKNLRHDRSPEAHLRTGRTITTAKVRKVIHMTTMLKVPEERPKEKVASLQNFDLFEKPFEPKKVYSRVSSANRIRIKRAIKKSFEEESLPSATKKKTPILFLETEIKLPTPLLAPLSQRSKNDTPTPVVVESNTVRVAPKTTMQPRTSIYFPSLTPKNPERNTLKPSLPQSQRQYVITKLGLQVGSENCLGNPEAGPTLNDYYLPQRFSPSSKSRSNKTSILRLKKNKEVESVYRSNESSTMSRISILQGSFQTHKVHSRNEK